MRKLDFFRKKKGELPRVETKIDFFSAGRANILQWWEPGGGEAKSKFSAGRPHHQAFLTPQKGGSS